MQTKRHPFRNALLSLLLASVVTCTLGLVFYSVEDPAGFEALTRPIVSLTQRLIAKIRWELVRDTVRSPATASDIALLRRPMPEEVATPEPPPVEEAPPVEEDPPGPSLTERILAQDVEALSDGERLLVYYNQLDPAWADKPFGWDPIGNYGCGPTSLSMVVSSLTGEVIDPEEMAAWAGSQGYSAPQQGSYLSIVEGTASYYKLNCAPVSTLDVDSLRQALSEGGFIVALMGPGHFTRGGHFIVLRGVTAEGKILVGDPASREKSAVGWDAELILRELSHSRSSGAPLWHITSPQ